MEIFDCEPRRVFEQFGKICSIPHGSGHTAEIAEFLLDFAKEHSLEAFKDNNNNVIIRKPGSKGRENAETICLQAHIDMVCEKEEGLEFDFVSQGIPAYVDGDWITSRGTTLGADDGIGVAMILAVLQDDELSHPPIEAILTSDEEIGLIGAQKLDGELITGRRLINLDSEESGIIFCGCAGGYHARSSLSFVPENTCGNITEVSVSGLTGGHSGICIHMGRGNANEIMARLLDAGLDKGVANLISIKGGRRDTAIPEECVMRLMGSRACINEMIHAAEDIRAEYALTDPGLKIEFTPKGFGQTRVLGGYDTIRLSHFMTALPNGPVSMCPELPDVVNTSVNTAVMSLEDGEFTLLDSVRSFEPSRAYSLIEKLRAITELAGGHFESGTEYPGWKYNPDSRIKNTVVSAYREICGCEPVVTAIHAGLECGILSNSVEGGIDCVSMGPTMTGVHTPKEKLSINDVAECYRILVKSLELA